MLLEQKKPKTSPENKQVGKRRLSEADGETSTQSSVGQRSSKSSRMAVEGGDGDDFMDVASNAPTTTTDGVEDDCELLVSSDEEDDGRLCGGEDDDDDSDVVLSQPVRYGALARMSCMRAFRAHALHAC